MRLSGKPRTRVLRPLATGVMLAVGVAAGSEKAPAPAPRPAAAQSVQSARAAEQTLIAAWTQTVDPEAMPVENMSLPIAHHPGGQVRALLKAVHALLPASDSDYVRARDVVIELYDPAGLLEGIFITDTCIYDRKTESGYCEGKVRIERRGVHITGTNMVWNLNNRSAKILSRPEVRFNRFMAGIGDAFK